MPKITKVRSLIGRRTYTTSEIARELGVHPQTVRSWVSAGMVPVNPNSYQKLYYGSAVKEFYRTRLAKKRTQLLPGQYLCFHCKRGVSATNVHEVDQGVMIGKGSASIRLVGKCAVCGGVVQQFAMRTKLSKVLAREKVINIDLQPSLFHSPLSGEE
jgi:hypothetical protein